MLRAQLRAGGVALRVRPRLVCVVALVRTRPSTGRGVPLLRARLDLRARSVLHPRLVGVLALQSAGPPLRGGREPLGCVVALVRSRLRHSRACRVPPLLRSLPLLHLLPLR